MEKITKNFLKQYRRETGRGLNSRSLISLVLYIIWLHKKLAAALADTEKCIDAVRDCDLIKMKG